jgi:NDP-sugar pyrophosphorylase family protein
VRAILLAGGMGTRLKPYTTLVPKPLVPIGGEFSIIEVVIRQLKRQGFERVTIAVNHLSQLIMAFIGDGSRWGMQVDYSTETEPLGTIGPLTLIPDLPESFLVMNGDVLTDFDFGTFYKDHVARGNPVSVAAFKRDSKIDFGVLRYDETGRLTAFQEKPVYHFDVSMGIYCISRKTIESLPRGKKYGFDDLMLDGLKTGSDIRIHPFGGFWLDIGRPDDYDFVNENYATIKPKLGIDS